MYDGAVPCEVIILKEDIWPAFYDLEDDPEAEDKIMQCVSVWYQDSTGSYHETAAGGYFHDVEEAKAAAEKAIAEPITWD